MINIPMNTKPALDLSSFGGPAPSTPNNQGMPMGNQQMGQPMNNNYGQQMGGQQMNQYGQPVNNNQYANPQYNQPVQNNRPVQNNYNQQPNQQPVQNNYSQAPVTQQARPAGDGVILKKGQKVDLMKSNANLTEIDVCLGWSILNQACDLDTSAFMLGANNRVIGDDWFVFYGQTASPDGSIIHHGDNRTGAGDGDDEVITVRLNQVNPSVQKITFVVTINEALERRLNFSMVKDAYIRIVDKSTNKELVKFNLTDYYSNVTSMVVGEVYRHNGTWKLNAVGDGVSRDLAGLCEMYGVNVAG